MTTRPIRLGLLGLLTCSATLAFASGDAAAEEPTIDQIEYHPAELPPEGIRSRLILVGTALTVGWYGAAVGTSYLWPDAPNSKDLRLPVVGPWMALGDVGCGPKESSCTTVSVIARTAFAVVSGVGQAGGLLAIFEGIVMNTGPSRAAAGGGTDSATSGTSWAASPVVLSGGGGVEFFGRF
jgi:hypothetical protein